MVWNLSITLPAPAGRPGTALHSHTSHGPDQARTRWFSLTMAHAAPGPKVAERTSSTRAPHALTITSARGTHGYDGVLPRPTSLC